MSVIQDAVKAMREVILLNDKVERSANSITELSKIAREHEIRMVKLETLVDVVKYQSLRNNLIEPTQ